MENKTTRRSTRVGRSYAQINSFVELYEKLKQENVEVFQLIDLEEGEDCEMNQIIFNEKGNIEFKDYEDIVEIKLDNFGRELFECSGTFYYSEKQKSVKELLEEIESLKNEMFLKQGTLDKRGDVITQKDLLITQLKEEFASLRKANDSIIQQNKKFSDIISERDLRIAMLENRPEGPKLERNIFTSDSSETLITENILKQVWNDMFGFSGSTCKTRPIVVNVADNCQYFKALKKGLKL